MHHRQAGFNLVEIMASLSLFAILATLGLPAIHNWASGLRVQLAAGEMAGVLRLARIHSARFNVKVAVKFQTDESGVVYHTLFRDGDGDGVRNIDIRAGIDPEIRAPRRLAHLGRRIRFGFPVGDPPRDPSNPRKTLDRLDDPIRFNRSDLASFNPRGTATPGTIYITDGGLYLAAIRVNNKSGKITVLYYDSKARIWR